MDFADEIAVVTGAASGIGRAIALALAGNAAAVFAADRDLDDAEQTAAAHDRITAAFLDLTSGSWISASRDEVARRFGAAAILVNAAGWDVWPVPGDQRAVLAGCRGHHLCRSRAGLPRVPAVDDRGRPAPSSKWPATPTGSAVPGRPSMRVPRAA